MTVNQKYIDLMEKNHIATLEQNEELRKQNRLLDALLNSNPTSAINQRILKARRDGIDYRLELRERMLETYGECIQIKRAAEIIGKAECTLHVWCKQGKIAKVEGVGILTASLADFIAENITTRDYKEDPLRPLRRSKVKEVKGIVV